ncbi:MAG: stage II sporulation protein R [Clostridium sp.]|nr:stage II sporulation protein R [Clostridium sp.]MCM1443742.1 stage II sporulation protein R [Candidatus Amulumruptor caecigallinarius]
MKTFITFILIISSFCIIGNIFEENVKIPDEAIRLRVVANSNDNYDQDIKKEVAISIQKEISNIIDSKDTIQEAKSKIKNDIPSIDKKINNIFLKNNYNLPYTINLGLNYFPQKEYKGVIYEEGYYESLLVTIGEGEGNNWWCVLFPPLCVLEAEENEEVEYKSLVKEIIERYI